MMTRPQQMPTHAKQILNDTGDVRKGVLRYVTSPTHVSGMDLVPFPREG